MSDAKTAKPVQFPVLKEPLPTRPAWLADAQAGALRKLFEPADETPSLPPHERTPGQSLRPSEMPPGAAGSVAQPSAAAATHSAQAAAAAATSATRRAADAADAAKPELTEQDELEHGLDERVLSKLPPPPKLGSLIPGARSAPPAANDAGVELLREQREAFTNAAIELGIARAATLAELEGQLLDLSIEIAAALIERELERDPALHTTLARAALASLGDAERVTLSTSRNGFEAICQTLGGAEATVSGVHVLVHADESIPGLGCIVDGENVRIDATVAERLRAVRRAFEDERRKVAESSE